MMFQHEIQTSSRNTPPTANTLYTGRKNLFLSGFGMGMLLGSLSASAAVTTYTDLEGLTSEYTSIYQYNTSGTGNPINGGNGDPNDPNNPDRYRVTTVVNGAIFTVDSTNAGTGVFDQFLAVQGSNKSDVQVTESGVKLRQERGTNYMVPTNANSANNDEDTGSSQHEVTTLGMLTAISYTGSEYLLNITDSAGTHVAGTAVPAGDYLEIRYDMNQAQSGTLPEISIFTELQVWVNSSAPPSSTPDYGVRGDPDSNWDGDNNPNTSSLGNMVWDLDAGTDRSIGIYQSNSGSGSSDAVILIPLDVFVGYSTTDYFSLWVEIDRISATGDGGAEQFSWLSSPDVDSPSQPLPPGTIVPEAGTMNSGTGVILLAAGLYYRRRNGNIVRNPASQ